MIVVALLVAGVFLMGRAKDRQLSENFRLSEFAVSSRFPTLATLPTGKQAQEVERGVRDILQPLRNRVGALHISSGYRPPALNRAIGGADHSDHMTGAAVDVTSRSFTDEQLIHVVHQMYLTGELVGLDQVISYAHTGHLHIGWGERARAQFLRASKNAAGKTIYNRWTP